MHQPPLHQDVRVSRWGSGRLATLDYVQTGLCLFQTFRTKRGRVVRRIRLLSGRLLKLERFRVYCNKCCIAKHSQVINSILRFTCGEERVRPDYGLIHNSLREFVCPGKNVARLRIRGRPKSVICINCEFCECCDTN